MQPGNVPGASRGTSVRNQELDQDRSQKKPHPEVDDTEKRNLHAVICTTHQRACILKVFIIGSKDYSCFRSIAERSENLSLFY